MCQSFITHIYRSMIWCILVHTFLIGEGGGSHIKVSNKFYNMEGKGFDYYF